MGLDIVLEVERRITYKGLHYIIQWVVELPCTVL